MTVVRSLARRWYVILPLLLLVSVAAWSVERSTPERYEASSMIRVVGPEVDPSRSAQRQVDLPGLAEAAASDQWRRTLEQQDLPATYEVRVVGSDRLQFSFVGDQERSIDAAGELLREAAREVEREQAEAGVAADERIPTRRLIEFPPQPGGAEAGDGEVLATLLLSDDPSRPNPLGRPDSVAQLLRIIGNSDQASRDIATATVAGVEYSITTGGRELEEGLVVEVSGPTEQATVAGVDAVETKLEELLNERQAAAQVPPGERLFLESLVRADGATNVSPAVSFLTVLTAGGGALLVLAGIAGVELLLQRRQEQPTHSATALSETGPADAPVGRSPAPSTVDSQTQVTSTSETSSASGTEDDLRWPRSWPPEAGGVTRRRDSSPRLRDLGARSRRRPHVRTRPR